MLIAGPAPDPDPDPDPDPVLGLGPVLGAETHDPCVCGFFVGECDVFGDHPVAPDPALVPVPVPVPVLGGWIWVCETPFVVSFPPFVFVLALVLVRSLYTNATKKFLKNH